MALETKVLAMKSINPGSIQVGKKMQFYPPSAGSVLYLPGYPPMGANIIDQSFSVSGVSNNGAITGAVWTRNPKGVWYLYFDGVDDYVECTSPFGDVDFKSQAFTIKLWINKDVLAAYHCFLSMKPTTAAKYGVQFWIDSSNKLTVTFRTADDGTTGPYLQSVATISALTWYQIIVTYDGNGTPDVNTVLAYINGDVTALSGLGDAAFTWFAANNKIWVGACGDTFEWDGGIALVELCSRVWDDVETLQSYQKEKHLFRV